MPWPSVTVEMGLGANPTSSYLVFDDTTRGLFGTGTFAPSGGLWTDISAYVREVETRRGRQRLAEAYQRGTCAVVLDNADGRFSPHNTSGPYYGNLRPECLLRVRVTYPGTTYSVFHGYVDSLLPRFGHPDGGECVVKATDAFKVLARFDPLAESAATGAGETVAARLDRILDNMNWPGGDRDLDTGESTLQATTLAQNALTEAQLSVDSEGGELFVSADGKVTFRDRHARYEDTTSNTVQATFTDANTAGVLHYESLDIPEYDADLVKNEVGIAATGGEQQTAQDLTSQAKYWVRPWARSDLIFDGGTLEAQHYADKQVFFFKEPEQRIDGIHLRGLSGSPAGLWAAMFGLDFGHRVRVVRTPVSGDALDKQLFVEGIEHSMRPGNHFTTTLRTSSATAVDASTFIFDHATLGKFDTGRFAVY